MICQKSLVVVVLLIIALIPWIVWYAMQIDKFPWIFIFAEIIPLVMIIKLCISIYDDIYYEEGELLDLKDLSSNIHTPYNLRSQI